MEQHVLNALQGGIIQAVANSSNPDLDVKYVGMNREKPEDDIWLELIYIPNNPEGEFWGDEKTYRGTLRLVLHCPQKNSSIYEYLNLLHSITDNLSKGLTLEDQGSNVKVSLTDNPDITGIIEEAPEILIPASLRYLYYDKS